MLYAVKMKDGTEFQVDAQSATDARRQSSYTHLKMSGKSSHCIQATPVTMCGPLTLVEVQSCNIA